MKFITGTASTIGVPELRAGCLVELQGLGPRFSGIYLIDEATHSIGDGGYQTELSLNRNAI